MDGFFLMLRNALRFGLSVTIFNVFAFMGRALISLGTCFFGYFLVTRIDRFSLKIYDTTPFILIFLATSYLISGVFMAVWNLACQTILHCFCIDEEVGEAKGGKAKYVPGPLKDFVDSRKK